MLIRKSKRYELDDVLPFVNLELVGGNDRILFDGDLIKMHSERLKTFKIKGCNCIKCGIKGAYFHKERGHKDELYHLNLYGINEKGEEVLMTKDHIIPKSKGGKDYIDNYQTMCCCCNTEKGFK
jgi:hypothetical protein